MLDGTTSQTLPEKKKKKNVLNWAIPYFRALTEKIGDELV
jgi:hypothetical protein